MSEQIEQLADRALRIIHSLQFDGRDQAHSDYSKMACDNEDVAWHRTGEKVYFESVPILCVLAESFAPSTNHDTLLRELRTAINSLEELGAIRIHPVPAGKAEIWPGAVIEVDVAVTPYLRLDGVIVTPFSLGETPWIEVGEIPKAFYPFGEKQLREALRIPLEKNPAWCRVSGLRVKTQPLYWVIRKMTESGHFPTKPAIETVLGYPAACSGFPPDKNYKITQQGITMVRGGKQHADECKKKKSDRGRPKATEAERKRDAQWAAAWNSNEHENLAKCADALGTTKPNLVKALDRHRKQNPAPEKIRQVN